MIEKKFLYIPSFDTAVSKNAGQKDFKLKDGTPWRFWNEKYPKKYQHKSYLITAGHNYKSENHSKKYDFPNDMLIFGDSGGYQICSGAIEWKSELKGKIFEWLEGNATVAMNLDLPPRSKMAGKFQECLDISVDNFKYFEQRQSGKVKYLNIIQGSDYLKYKTWYKKVANLNFSGWAIGGSGGDILAMMSGLCVLLENKEHLNHKNEYLHFLGASGVFDFLIFAKIQLELNLVGSNLTITTDSSTPSRSTSYGYYYIGYDLRSAKFRYINLPNKHEKLNREFIINHPPIITEIDELIWKEYTLDEFINWDQYHYAWAVSHNFAIFKDCYEACNNMIYTDSYIYEQCFTPEIVRILNSVKEMINSESPYLILEKYRKLYENASRLSLSDSIKSTPTFF